MNYNLCCAYLSSSVSKWQCYRSPSPARPWPASHQRTRPWTRSIQFQSEVSTPCHPGANNIKLFLRIWWHCEQKLNFDAWFGLLQYWNSLLWVQSPQKLNASRFKSCLGPDYLLPVMIKRLNNDIMHDEGLWVLVTKWKPLVSRESIKIFMQFVCHQ